VAFTLLPGVIYIEFARCCFMYVTWHFTCPNYSW